MANREAEDALPHRAHAPGDDERKGIDVGVEVVIEVGLEEQIGVGQASAAAA